MNICLLSNWTSLPRAMIQVPRRLTQFLALERFHSPNGFREVTYCGMIYGVPPPVQRLESTWTGQGNCPSLPMQVTWVEVGDCGCVTWKSPGSPRSELCVFHGDAMPGHTELCTLMARLSEHRDESKRGCYLWSILRCRACSTLAQACSKPWHSGSFRPLKARGRPPTVSQYLGSSTFRIPDAQDELSINVYIIFRVLYFKSMDTESHAFL